MPAPLQIGQPQASDTDFLTAMLASQETKALLSLHDQLSAIASMGLTATCSDAFDAAQRLHASLRKADATTR